MMGRSQFVCLLILLQFLDSCFALPLCTDSSKSLIIELQHSIHGVISLLYVCVCVFYTLQS